MCDACGRERVIHALTRRSTKLAYGGQYSFLLAAAEVVVPALLHNVALIVCWSPLRDASCAAAQVVKKTGVSMRNRIIPAPAVALWRGRVEALADDVEALYAEERKEKELRKAEMEAQKVGKDHALQSFRLFLVPELQQVVGCCTLLPTHDLYSRVVNVAVK